MENTILQRVTAFAPATMANVGSAFDVIGFALESPGDSVTVSRSTLNEIRITGISGDQAQLSYDPTKNTAAVSIQSMITALRQRGSNSDVPAGLDIELKKGLPIGSGLGSSSASTVAGVFAANELLGNPFQREELLPFAMEGERIACGSAHADNVGPSLLGGCVLIRSYEPLDVITLPTPQSVWVSVVTPEIEVRTEDARRILHATVSLQKAVSQWGNVAALVAGIFRDDPSLIGRALEDKIIEPERATLIPGFYQAQSGAITAGALGCSISGSGPSVFAISSSVTIAENIVGAIKSAFLESKINSTGFTSRINSTGAVILDRC